MLYGYKGDDKMKEETFIKLWKIVQISLFGLPIILFIVYIPYEISYDEGYINEVIPRVLDNGEGFEGAVEDWKDSEGTFYNKKWKLEHKELYFFNNLFNGILVGIFLQVFNFVWGIIRETIEFDDTYKYEYI